ncbi:MAG: MFS transporter [Methanobrevibacter sp.]|uniref:MFS transporter n=1 Tax=Methanobrevibacter sp. TaxID=66852 RepID=UPI0026DFE5BE|nr:MFS transporter [Methanobrevibacter sp.]MDO5849036.1 MFS transporter [Methanobrevibacter sp.]
MKKFVFGRLKSKNKRKYLRMVGIMRDKLSIIIFLLAFGTFGILTTEMGFVGILQLVATKFNVSVGQASLFVSLFALGVAIAGIIMPLIFSKFNYKKSLLLVLLIFVISNILSIFVTDFNLALIIRVIPAFFHPIFCSFALTLAADLVNPDESLKAVSRVIMGVSAGMVLGVPIINFLAFNGSYQIAMLFMAIINAISFIGLLIFMPSIEPKESISYGDQVSVIKKPVFLLSILGVVFLTAGLYSVYSFISVYLSDVSHIVGFVLTFALFLYGLTSIIGNYIGGHLLSFKPIKTVFAFPFVLSAIYLLIFGFNQFVVVMLIIIAIWGVIAGLGNNIQQYWIVSSAPEAPEFANGIFLSSGNVGITIGTGLSSMLIAGIGIDYILFGGIFWLILALISVVIRNIFNKRLHNTNQSY